VPVASVQDPTFRVEFDLAVLAEDSDHSTPKGRSVMRDAIRGFDRDGISASRLKACEDPGRDGTRLAGCAKTYLPPPDGSWGMVFQLRLDDDQRPFLACLAFGIRHPSLSWQPSVYQVADRRLHAADGRPVATSDS
jgi:hypothetical protein